MTLPELIDNLIIDACTKRRLTVVTFYNMGNSFPKRHQKECFEVLGVRGIDKPLIFGVTLN